MLMTCLSVSSLFSSFDISFGELYTHDLQSKIETIGRSYKGEEQARELGTLLRTHPGANTVGTAQQGTLLHIVSQAPFSVDSLKRILATYPDWDIDKEDVLGTPLHYAATDTVEKVRVLITNNANLSARTRLSGKTGAKETPLERSIDTGKLDIADVLIQKGSPVDENTLATAARSGSNAAFQKVKNAIKGGLSESQKYTALRHALQEMRYLRDFRFTDTEDAIQETKQIIQWLLDRVNTKKIPNDIVVLAGGTTRDTVKLLWNKGINLMVKQGDGKTPLHMAAHEGASSGVIQYLLDTGFSRTNKDNTGDVPLTYAQRYKRHISDMLDKVERQANGKQSFITKDYVQRVRDVHKQMEAVVRKLTP